MTNREKNFIPTDIDFVLGKIKNDTKDYFISIHVKSWIEIWVNRSSYKGYTQSISTS